MFEKSVKKLFKLFQENSYFYRISHSSQLYSFRALFSLASVCLSMSLKVILLIIYKAVELADFNNLKTCCQGCNSKQSFLIDVAAVHGFSFRVTKQFTCLIVHADI